MEGYVRGHRVTWDGESRCWRYTDTEAVAEHYGGAGEYRPCAKCGRLSETCPRGCALPHDPCIGHVDGAIAVCCGHGVEVGYVNWDGLSIPGTVFNGVRVTDNARSQEQE